MKLEELWIALLREVIGEPVLTPPEVAAAAGVEAQEARRFWRALGFGPVPDDERVFTQADVSMLQTARALVDRGIIKSDTALQVTRVMGQTLARLAETQVMASSEHPDGAAQSADPVPAATVLAQVLEPFVTYAWKRHLLAALWRQITARANLGGDTHRLIVGFADMVGFTAMSQMLSDRELEQVVNRFESLVYEQVPERGGRVIKLIGDEVMFVAERAADVAEIALGLVDAHAGDATLPDIRVGLAVGPAISWEGDIYGPTVNLASRLVNLARPASVLVSPELAEMLREEPAYVLRDLRPVVLKGIGRTQIKVLRRAPSQTADGGDKRKGARRAKRP